MESVNRTTIPGIVIVLVSMLASTPALAQIDLSGEWRSASNEYRILNQVGEYVGLPINEAGRLRADSWDAALLSLPEYQCVPHSMHTVEHSASMGQMRIWKVIDPVTQQLIAYQKRGTIQEPERTIWMDGRPHPPEYARHKWQGFSTGKWEGNMLTVTTTHIKTGDYGLNKVAGSDRAVITEHFVRHGNYLTNITSS